MPGEQPGENNIGGEKHLLPPAKAAALKQTLGRVISGIEFQQFADAGLVKKLEIEIRTDEGDVYSVMQVSGLGFAIGNYLTKRVYIIEITALFQLAKLCGIDRPEPLVFVQGSEVRRGA